MLRRHKPSLFSSDTKMQLLLRPMERATKSSELSSTSNEAEDVTLILTDLHAGDSRFQNEGIYNTYLLLHKSGTYNGKTAVLYG